MKNILVLIFFHFLFVSNSISQVVEPINEDLSVLAWTIENIPNPKDNGGGFVSNPNGFLSDVEKDELNGLLTDLEKSTTIEFAVVILNSIGEEVPKDFANKLFNYWKIGKAEKDNGLLLLVVMDQRRMEVETGYGLEYILTDAICKSVQVEVMVPYFKEGKPGQGIIEGVKNYCNILQNYENKEVQTSFQNDINEAKEEYFSFLESFLFRFIISILFGFTFFIFMIALYFVKFKKLFNSSDLITKNTLLFPVIKKGVWFVLYCCTPYLFILTFLLSDKNILLAIPLLGYTYSIILLSEKIFRKVKAALQEDDLYLKYIKLKLACQGLGWKAIIFPLPFMLFWFSSKIILMKIKIGKRSCPSCHSPLLWPNHKIKNIFLTKEQNLQEKIGSIFYDIKKCSQCNFFSQKEYDNKYSKYIICEACNCKTSYFLKTIKKVRSTTQTYGTGAKVFTCINCKNVKEELIQLPMLDKFTISSTSSKGSSSSSSSKSSSSSSSSSSSRGGGSSGGGGAGSSW